MRANDNLFVISGSEGARRNGKSCIIEHYFSQPEIPEHYLRRMY
jgi:hypothetical protein